MASTIRSFLVALTVTWLLLRPAPAHAAAPPAEDAFSMLQEQTVTGVTKRPLPLSEAPSSVTIIPAVEIRAMGYHSLADALRWVRGLYVTYDRNYAYVGVRGLQRPGDYNNRILLSIDGHSMTGSVYGDAYIGPELGLDLEEVERIEVVRGPGSAVYGSAAALAVVNVVTRRAGAMPPASASLRFGGAGEWVGRASVASSRPGMPELHASVSWLQAQGRPLTYFDPEAAPFEVRVRDSERAASFYGTARWAGFALTAKLNDRRKTVPPSSYAIADGDVPSASWDGRDFVELSTTRPLGPALELSTRAYWDGSRYQGRWFWWSDEGAVQNRDYGDGDVIGTEVRTHWAPTTGQALTFGIEGQRTVRTHFSNYDVEPYTSYYDQHLTGNLLALYAQDELRLGSRVILTAGARLDNDSRFKAVWSPRADLVWSITRATRLKLLGGSAFRAPSAFEILQRTVPGRLTSERVVTYEAGLEHQGGPFLFLATGYQSYLRDLIDLAQIDEMGYTTFTNLNRVRCQGLEGAVRFNPSPGSHARLGFACQRSQAVGTGDELSNSPRWNLHALGYRTLRDRLTTVGVGVRYLSQRISSPGLRSAAVAVCDARLARELAPGLAIALEARNLFDARYGDPGWGEYLGQEYRQDPRSVYLVLTAPASEAR